MATTVVASRDVKGRYNKKTRELKRADYRPYIHFDKHNNDRPSLAITRFGDHELLPISRRVAEELLANGFSRGDCGS